MAQVVKLKRSGIAGKVPDTSSLELGEIAINTFDGRAFIKKSGSGFIESVVHLVTTNALTTGSINLSGSFIVTGSVNFSGSLNVRGGGITGSLFGTASWAQNVVTASYALNGVTISNNVDNYVLTATGVSGSINGESGLIFDSSTGILEVNSNIDIGSGNTHIDSGIIVIGSNNIAGTSGGAGNYILIGQANELNSRFKNSLVVGGKVIIDNDTQQSIIAGISHSIGANRNILASGEGLYVYDSDERLIIGKYNVRNTENPKVSSSLFTIGSGKGDGTRNDLLNVFPNNYDLPQSAEVVVTGSILASNRIQAPSFTGSLFGTASWAIRALTASLATTASFTISASFATTASFVISASFARTASFATTALTASFVNNLNQNLSITGALILSGSTAPELIVIGDTQFTGSITSLYGYTGSLFGTSSWAIRALTASLATTASFALSASFATTASFVISSSYALSSSFATTALSASFATTASFVISSSYALSSSFATTALSASFATTALTASTIYVISASRQLAYFNSLYNLSSSNDIKVYEPNIVNSYRAALKVGKIEPTPSSNYSGSHVLIEGKPLITNARIVPKSLTPSLVNKYYILGFGGTGLTIDSVEPLSYMDNPEEGIDDYGNIHMDSVIQGLGGSLPSGQNYSGTFPRSGSINGVLNVGSVYITVNNAGQSVVVANQFTTLPGSPGFTMGNGNFLIYRSESMVFSDSGALLSPPSSASVQFSLASDSSSLSILVGKENLQEIMFLSYSSKEPKIGVGTSQPKSIFDIKSIADNSIGTELLIRSARTELKGGDTGDAAGKIIFSIDSSSYNNLKTSGSVAIITSEVTSISSEGAAGDLILKASNTDKNEPSEVLRINNDTSIFSSSLNVKGQLLTLSSSQFAVINATINSDADSNVNTFSTSVYKGGFYDYTLMSSAGARIGQFMVLSGSSNLTFTDTSAPAIGGDPVEPSLSASFSGPNLISVRITNGNGYTFKAIRKLL